LTILFKDDHAYAHKCVIFQTCADKQRKLANLLKPVIIDEPFQQWDVDVISEINPHLLMQHRYILSATNYFTRWVEVILPKQVNTNQVIEFLEYNIITRFGTPLTLVFDNVVEFGYV